MKHEEWHNKAQSWIEPQKPQEADQAPVMDYGDVGPTGFTAFLKAGRFWKGEVWQ